MIQIYVVHVVVDVIAEHELVGVIEDVQTGDRRRFLGAEELVAHLVDRLPGDTTAPTVEAASPPVTTER